MQIPDASGTLRCMAKIYLGTAINIQLILKGSLFVILPTPKLL